MFTTDDKVLILARRVDKGWGARKMMNENEMFYFFGATLYML